MKHFSPSKIVFTSALLLCHFAFAENQQPGAERFPAPKPGIRYSYVNGVFLLKCNRWEVKEVNKGGEIVSKCGDYTTYANAENGNAIMAVNDKGETVVKFTPFYPTLSFPLFVGKKWTGKYNGRQGTIGWSSDVACESITFEEVQVAAGKFDAFRIECVDKWDSGIVFIRGTRKSTTWYAPAIGSTIKSVNDDSNWDFELAGGDWH